MKIPFKPLPDDEPPLTIPQFLARLKHDPGFAEKMQAHYESMLALPLNADTGDMHKAASAALRTLRHHQGAWKAKQAFIQAQDLMEEDGFTRNPDVLRSILALNEEAIDHLLDVLEPERTHFMAKFTSIQADIRRMLAEL